MTEEDRCNWDFDPPDNPPQLLSKTEAVKQVSEILQLTERQAAVWVEHTEQYHSRKYKNVMYETLVQFASRRRDKRHVERMIVTALEAFQTHGKATPYDDMMRKNCDHLLGQFEERGHEQGFECWRVICRTYISMDSNDWKSLWRRGDVDFTAFNKTFSIGPQHTQMLITLILKIKPGSLETIAKSAVAMAMLLSERCDMADYLEWYRESGLNPEPQLIVCASNIRKYFAIKLDEIHSRHEAQYDHNVYEAIKASCPEHAVELRDKPNARFCVDHGVDYQKIRMTVRSEMDAEKKLWLEIAGMLTTENTVKVKAVERQPLEKQTEAAATPPEPPETIDPGF